MKNVSEIRNYKFTENSFKFVQSDAKLSDVKLDTKPRTAAQDAFRRFCKNKSSVVAAVILGLLILLSLIVPLFSSYDVGTVHLSETFLEPKLFNAGFGFWDGTKKYTKTYSQDGSVQAIVYDTVNKVPAGFTASAVYNLVVDEKPTLVNVANTYGTGGSVIFENQSDSVTYLNSSTFTPTAADNYKVNIILRQDESGQLGEYRVLLKIDNDEIVLKDWSKDYSSYTLDLSGALVAKNIDSLHNARLSFELKPAEKDYSHILLERCVFTTDDDDAFITSSDGAVADFSELGFADATRMILKAPNSQNVFPAGYWSSNGRKGIVDSEVYYCTFVYDTYEAVYGEVEVVYAASDFNDMIAKGWCEYDAEVGPSSFKRLSDECPITEVLSQKVNSRTGRLQEITGVSYKYRALGYKKMPRFLFGTDASGMDLFTRIFTGMRTSLLLGVCTAAFCLVFGLCWGSISGYFGGTVDLAMERFCDILGGVPWIVIMTLCILHLGNNFATFFLALCMTGWMGTAARTRTQFYRFKGREYVLASRTLGSSDMRLIFKHILPNALGTIVTSSVLMIPSTIFSEATLSYLNLGLQGKEAFGVLLSSNQQYIQTHPFLIVFPSVIMALLMISFNLFGNGLRDALNPSLRGAEG